MREVTTDSIARRLARKMRRGESKPKKMTRMQWLRSVFEKALKIVRGRAS